MTKTEFLNHLKEAYRIGNAADTDNREDWTKPVMARCACIPIDQLLQNLLDTEVITEDERQRFYDTL